MGKCISHITRKDWYKNCNKGCLYCFGYNCDMCTTDISDSLNKCFEVFCYFCSFGCCECECRFLKDCWQGIKNKVDPCCSSCSRYGEDCLKLFSNECDDMCECHCYCENPCVFRDENNKQLQTFLNQYKIKVNFHDNPIFGESSIMQSITSGELFTLKVIENHNENVFLQTDLAFKRRQQVYHPNIVNLKRNDILKLFFIFIIICRFAEIKIYIKIMQQVNQDFYLTVIDVESFTEDQFCTLNIKNILFFDFLLVDLETEIKFRKKTNFHFKEEELWNLIEGTLQALYFFQELKLEHRALRSNRIYANQQGIFKIADPYLFQSSINFEDVKQAYQQSDPIPNKVYLSPDQFYKIVDDEQFRILNRFENRMKSDIFTLGMIILSAATLENLSNIYNYDDSHIDIKKIYDKIESVQQRYKSPILGKLLFCLLEENQDKRLDAKKCLLLIAQDERVKQAIINSRIHNNQIYNNKDAQTPFKQRSLRYINEMFFENENFHFQNLGNNSFEDKISNPLDISRGGAANISVNKPGMFNQMQPPMMRTNSPQTNRQTHQSHKRNDSSQIIKKYNKIVDGKTLDFAFSGLEDSEQIQLRDLGTIVTNPNQKTLLERCWFKCKESKMYQKMNCCKKKTLSPEQILSEVKEGVLYDENKNVIYEGNLYQEKVKHGQGKFYEENTIFIGHFNFDKKDGQGKITDKNDNVQYEGHFVNDKKEGEGKEYSSQNDNDKTLHFQNFYKNWKQFEGSYKNGKKNGKGTYTYFNDHKFECNFVNNFAEGEGTYYSGEGQVLFKAMYKRNKIQKVIQNFSFNPQPQGLQLGNQPSKQSLNNSFAQQSHHSLLTANNHNAQSGNSPQNINFFLKQAKTENLNDSFFK